MAFKTDYLMWKKWFNAELIAEDEILMSMEGWIEQMNQFLRNNRRDVFKGKGKFCMIWQ